MIRFPCPHCHRPYEVLEALARLAIVCKGCGQPMTVPEKSTTPQPEPQPALAPPPPPRPEPPTVVAPPAPPPAPLTPAPVFAPEPVAVVTESRLPPEKPALNGAPSAHPTVNGLFEKPDVLATLDGPAPSSPLPAPPAPTRGRKLLGRIVDGVVMLVLIGAGVFCGELLARQSTMEVLKDAATAAKFPPIDLLMWLAPTVVLLLVYVLLISRGKSLGNRFGT